MKKLLLLFSIASMLLITGCASNDESSLVQSTPDKELTGPELINVINSLYSEKDYINDQIVETELGKYVDLSKFDKTTAILTRSYSSATLPQDAIHVIDSINTINPEEYPNSESYYNAIRLLIENNRNQLSEVSYNSMIASIDIALNITNLYLEEKAYQDNSISNTRAKQQAGWWGKWGKCAAGIGGGAITGALGGAGIGFKIFAFKGAAVGAIIGAIGGGLTGAAAAC